MWDMWGDSCKRGLGGGSLIDQTDEATAKSVVPDVGGPGRWAYLEVILVSLVFVGEEPAFWFLFVQWERKL